MAPIVLHEGIVNLDDASGVAQDVSDFITGVTINVEVNSGGHHTLGNYWEQASRGGARWSGDLEMTETADDDSAHELIRNALTSATETVRTLTVETPDDAVGSLSYSGEIMLTNLSPAHQNTGGSGDVVKPRASFRGHDALTIAVIT